MDHAQCSAEASDALASSGGAKLKKYTKAPLTIKTVAPLVPRFGHWRRLRPGVSAPSEAWRFLQGASPCGVRSNQPLLPSVAPVKEVQTERHRCSVHRVP